MKRNKEVQIIVKALVQSEIICKEKITEAKNIVRNALKEVRREKYKEKQKNH